MIKDRTASPPRIGMVATVRNRRGIISSVRPFDGPEGRLHLIEVEYNDGDSPMGEFLLWEREAYARLLPPSALPQPLSDEPMPHVDLTALVRACRWSARTPYIDPDGTGPMARLPITSPFHGALQIEDYQLVPLLKALRMPRVSLLIADDVGLGKTIEAGLILSELILRRRIRRVLVLTPASLRLQWRDDELWGKFSLPFEVVDRDSTMHLRRKLGLDANPWRSHSRIIASYHYLKQPDVLEQFHAASQPQPGQAHLPWDMLIVDEAHNLTPRPFGDESDLCKMLRQIAPLFEHRLFLTATPHNGHTRSFTGLLELLDPVRFTQTEELRPAERARVRDVVIRRLKREINARTEPRKFCRRMPPEALMISLAPGEKALSDAFNAFRAKIRSLIGGAGRKRRLAGNFAIEILGKRLLSCPFAFAESWRRCRHGLREEGAVEESEVIAAQRSVTEETVDDREAESRGHTAAATVGAWLKPMAEDLRVEIAALEAALEMLGLGGENTVSEKTVPRADARFEALLALLEERLLRDGAWREDERLVIFTEYKTTLDYLLRRLREWSSEPDRVLALFGGMDDAERKVIKDAFNSEQGPVRILVATDAASEGLNLQKTARCLLHYDVPWNPARLEQRNGRLDRYGQARDVTVRHFLSGEDQDLAFLDLIVRKVDSIREDLGATGDVFDEITCRRLIEGAPLEGLQLELDGKLEIARRRSAIPRDDRSATGRSEAENDPAGDLATIAAELDFDPEALRETLDSAMALAAGRPRLSDPDENGRSSIIQPHPAAWNQVIDDTVRLPSSSGAPGPLPRLAFDPDSLVIKMGGRPIFQPRADTLLMHLRHPLLQKALTSLTRQRFPGSGEHSVSRWTVSRDGSLEGADALILLTLEELAVNALRETFHHWVRTVRLPVREGQLGDPLPHLPALALRRACHSLEGEDIESARDLWLEVEGAVREYLGERADRLTRALERQLEADRETALEDESRRYQSRQGEVSALIESSTMKRLEKEIENLKNLRKQGLLFDQERHLEELDRDIELKGEELKRRRLHYEELREQLARERERIVNQLIPNRTAMRGRAQVMPVAIEIALPGKTP